MVALTSKGPLCWNVSVPLPPPCRLCPTKNEEGSLPELGSTAELRSAPKPNLSTAFGFSSAATKPRRSAKPFAFDGGSTSPKKATEKRMRAPGLCSSTEGENVATPCGGIVAEAAAAAKRRLTERVRKRR